MDITKQWVVENGEGHWLIRTGDVIVTCDDGELNEILQELEAA